MADTFMMNVPPNFNLAYLGDRLRDSFQAKGFTVSMVQMNNSLRMTFDKGCGGINMILGMGQGITATCSIQGNSLVVNYSDAEWTGKIIGLVVGWLLCLIPFITALIGCINQSQLPKTINNEIMMIVNS